MVSYAEVLVNNTSLPSSSQNLNAVFVGATHGIGLGAVRALAKHATNATIFLLGRSDVRLSEIASGLREINPDASVHTIETGDLALLANVKKALEKFKNHPSTPSKVDLLVLSPGYLSAASRNPTPEALDHLTSVRYYSRMLFTTSLLPLLRLSRSPRVISILAGGKEGQLWPDDFLLETHYSFPAAAGAAAAMTTLFMESLAAVPENAKVSFIHLFPGLVTDTQNLQQVEHWGWVMRMLLAWVVLPLLSPFGRKSVEAGERVLFAGTTGRFGRGAEVESVGSNGKVGSGVYLVQGDGSVVVAAKVTEEMRRDGVGGMLWEHTMGVLATVK